MGAIAKRHHTQKLSDPKGLQSHLDKCGYLGADVQECSNYAGVGPGQIRNWVKNGVICAIILDGVVYRSPKR